MITSKKHTNAKHLDQKKSVDNLTEDKGKFYCDECPVNFKNKKNLKKHKEKEHSFNKHMTEQMNNDENLNCSATCDCKKCVDEWVYYTLAATKVNKSIYKVVSHGLTVLHLSPGGIECLLDT